MPKLVVPGFGSAELSTRLVRATEEVREGIDMPNCEAQLFVFGYPAHHIASAHSHEETRITLVRSGRASFSLGGSTVDFGPGDVVLIPAGVVHGFEAAGEDPFLIAEFVVPVSCGSGSNAPE